MRTRNLTEEQRHRLVTRGGALAALSQHPSWPDFVEELKAKEERLKRVIVVKVMSKLPVDQREIDFMRGFIAGMQYIATVPENAEARLESYLKEHGVDAGRSE